MYKLVPKLTIWLSIFSLLPKVSKLYRSKSSTSLTHTLTHSHTPEDFLSFEARDLKICTQANQIILRHFT